MRRATISQFLSVTGIGLHSGSPSTVTIHPAPRGSGITICAAGSEPFPIGVFTTVPTDRCTRVVDPNGATIDTIEHLMAAISIRQLTDLAIQFSAPEVPILDGSACEWVSAFDAAGICSLPSFSPALHVTREFDFEFNGARFSASPGPLSFDVTINFANKVIGTQRIHVLGDDLESLANSRTFVLEHEIAVLRSAGLALGGGLHNAVVIGQDGPLNEEGFRHTDECVRHKTLDLIGDLSLLGVPVLGAFTAYRPGHSANGAFLKALVTEGILSAQHTAAA